MIEPEILREFIESSKLKYKENGNSFILDCPLCGHSEKFYIRKKDGASVCWTCTETETISKRVEYRLSQSMGVPISIVKSALYGSNFMMSYKGPALLDLKLKESSSEEEFVLPELPPVEVPDNFCGPDHPVFAAARSYLIGRGIPEDLIRLYNIMYNPNSERIIFPLMIDGIMRGWTDRYIGKKESWTDKDGNIRKMPKTLTNLDRGKSLLFQDKIKGSKHVVLCEGPFDALKCHYLGGSVASMGKQVTKIQLDILLSNNPEKIYLALDPDAFDKTMEIVKYFYAKDHTNIYLLVPPSDKKDLGDCTFEEVAIQFSIASSITPSHLLSYFKP